MACSLDFIEFVCRQIEAVGAIRYRKMFGDYMIYANEKPVIIACDNIAFVKQHEAIEALMAEAEKGYPYEGAKEHYILDVSRADHAAKVVAILAEVLPYPKKRKKKEYKLLNVYQRIKSPKVKLLGILALHIGKRRYLSINIDPVMSCNLRCKMCYFSDAETAKKMRGKFSSDDLEAIAKSLFPRALRLQIGCGAEPTVSQNLLQLVQLGKQYGVKHITITTNGNLLTYEKLHKLVENGLTEITLSAHGFTKNTYESLMTNGKFDLFTALIENLARIRTDFLDFRIRVNYTVNADNAEELIQLKEVFKDAKPNVVQIRPIQRIGKSSYNNFSLQTIKDNYNSWIMPVVAYCQQENITCLYPTPESLEMLETVNGAEEKSNSLVDSLPYFYIAPYEGWKEKIDPYNESFEKYAQRTRRISTILRELVGIGTVKGERSRTKSLNYQIK